MRTRNPKPKNHFRAPPSPLPVFGDMDVQPLKRQKTDASAAEAMEAENASPLAVAEEAEEAEEAKKLESLILEIKDADDGGLIIKYDSTTTIISKHTMDILERISPDIFAKRLGWGLSQGYIASGWTKIHRVMGQILSDAEAKKTWALHYAIHDPKNDLVIGHLNDNRLDFNIENLQKIPSLLNIYSQKSYPNKTASEKVLGFKGAVGYNNKRTNTKTVGSYDECLHCIDIWKIELAPVYFRDYLFLHCLHRPEAYLQHYASLDMLMKRAELPCYKKEARAQQAPRESQNQYVVYRSIDSAKKDVPPKQFTIIEDGVLKKPGLRPFDPTSGAIIHYIGALGAEHIFMCDYTFYISHMHVSKPSISAGPAGHLLIQTASGKQYLHLLVLGRSKGQSKLDGKVGGHGAGKILDNRLEVLKELTPGENSSDCGDASTQSAPDAVGVVFNKGGGKYKAQIGDFFKLDDKIHLGYFENSDIGKAAGAAAYKFAYDNKAALIVACKDMDSVARNKHVRACAKAGRLDLNTHV